MKSQLLNHNENLLNQTKKSMGTGHQTEIATSTKHQLKTTAVSETILTSLEANTQSIFQDSPRTTEVRFLEIKTLMHTWVQPHIQISHHQPKILH